MGYGFAFAFKRFIPSVVFHVYWWLHSVVFGFYDYKKERYMAQAWRDVLITMELIFWWDLRKRWRYGCGLRMLVMDNLYSDVGGGGGGNTLGWMYGWIDGLGYEICGMIDGCL